MKKLRRNDIAQDTIRPAIEFLKQIKSNDKAVIIHAHDNDSVCSAAILYKLLEKIGIKPDLVISEFNFSFGETTVKKVKRLNPSYIIVVDIPEIGVNVVTELTKIAKVLVIDHHKPKGYVRVTYINPRMYDNGAYLPTTYLSYKIYESFFNPKDIVWIAGIGTLADMGIKNCLDLFQKIKTVNKELVNDLKPEDEELFEKSLLGKLTKIVDSARIVDNVKGSIVALKALIETKNYKGILENKKLLKYFELSEREFNRLVEDFHRNKKLIENILIYEIKSKFNFKSPLATYLQKLFNDNILIVYQKGGKYYEFSFRRGKNVNVDLSQLAENSTRNIPDSNGGGHIAAAGARIPIRYLNLFVKNLGKQMQTV